jgi:ParB family chromosome partitioning protein
MKPPRPAAALPELENIPLALIAEPELPARERMDAEALYDLKLSLAELGLLSPIVVKRKGAGFQVVAGHRRFLAARELHWHEIRAFVYPAGWQDADAAMLHENIVREALNPAEEAIFFAQLLEKNKLDEAGLCRLVKRSPDYIGDRLELLRRDPEVFEALRHGRITYSVARVLNRWPDEQMRRYHLDQAIRSGTSGRVVQQWWDEWKSYHVPDAQRVNQNTPVPPQLTAEYHTVECALCGGFKDPYNLVAVMIHKWELLEMQRLVRDAELKALEAAGQPVTSEAETADKPNGGVK